MKHYISPSTLATPVVSLAATMAGSGSTTPARSVQTSGVDLLGPTGKGSLVEAV